MIDRLASFDSRGACVLSTYLSLSPENQIERTYRTVFKEMAKEMREELDEPRREALEAEVTRVRDWLESTPPRGLGLAIFSCTPAGLWETLGLHVPVRDRLVFESTPYVAPLLDLLDEYERYAVALVDKEKARFFSVFLGEIEETDDFKDFVPAKHDQGGVSQANFQRHHEAHVFRHLQRVADYLTDLHRRRPFDRLILAGPEEATSELRHCSRERLLRAWWRLFWPRRLLARRRFWSARSRSNVRSNAPRRTAFSHSSSRRLPLADWRESVSSRRSRRCSWARSGRVSSRMARRPKGVSARTVAGWRRADRALVRRVVARWIR